MVASLFREATMAAWSRCDDILVLDLYFKVGRRVLSTRDPNLIKVSELVGKSEGSVRMKMQNYLHLDDPTRRGSLSNASQQSKLVWRKYASDKRGLREAATNCESEIK